MFTATKVAEVEIVSDNLLLSMQGHGCLFLTGCCSFVCI